MYSSITVKKPLTNAADEARPVSHVAAATLLCTSIAAVHFGAESALKGAPELAWTLTGAIVAIEWLQWTALGRIAKLDDAGEHARANMLKLQSAGVGVLQVILYTVAVLGFATKAGASWSEGLPLFGSIVIATLYAGLNFIVKWTSCEAVAAPASSHASGPNGGTRKSADELVFGTAPIAAQPGNITELKARVERHADRQAHGAFKTRTEAAPPRKPTGAASEAGRNLALKRWNAG